MVSPAQAEAVIIIQGVTLGTARPDNKGPRTPALEASKFSCKYKNVLEPQEATLVGGGCPLWQHLRLGRWSWSLGEEDPCAPGILMAAGYSTKATRAGLAQPSQLNLQSLSAKPVTTEKGTCPTPISGSLEAPPHW